MAPKHVYLSIDGIRIKFGDGRTMNKVGFDEYQQLLADNRLGMAPNSVATPEHYSSRAHDYVWRFPWPDEHGQPAELIQRRLVLRSAALAMDTIHLGHQSAEATLSNRWGVYVTMPVACPHSERGKELADKPRPQTAQIIGEAFNAGSRATLFACEFCDVMFYLTDPELEIVRAQNPDQPEVCALLRAVPQGAP